MSEDPMLGRVLGDRFEIVSLIGRGGMASVYQARDTVLDRVVAIKVFAVDTSDDRARLESEVRLLSGLNHPNLVTVHDASLTTGADDGPSFLVMEFVGGATLRDEIATSAVAGDVIVAVASGISEALQVVHKAGIVHRDVKPANILIESDAPTVSGFRAKLADFGIARSLESARLTATQTVIGTVGYLSPEQAAGAAVTSASDIYSLGLVLLECFTGQTEYPGNAAESLVARLSRDPVLPSSIPPGWSTLLGSMLARDPAVRPSAQEVARTSALLAGELVGPYPMRAPAVTPTEPLELAKTRVLPAAAAVNPDPLTAPTRVMTDQSATPAMQSVKPATARRPFPSRTALIAVAAVALVLIIVVVLISLARGLSQVTAPPSTSVTSSTPSPTRSVVTPTPTPPPGKGKGHGKKH